MAVSSPLLEASIDGAHGVLLSVAGGSDLGIFEISQAAGMVADAVHPEANIIFGAIIDDALGDEVRITVIAAGFDGGTPPRKREAGSALVVPTPDRSSPRRTSGPRSRRAASPSRHRRSRRRRSRRLRPLCRISRASRPYPWVRGRPRRPWSSTTTWMCRTS